MYLGWSRSIPVSPILFKITNFADKIINLAQIFFFPCALCIRTAKTLLRN